MAREHFALYGNVALQRQYCKSCRGFSFVLDSKLLCCNSPTDFESRCTKRMSEAEDVRRHPNAEEKRGILEFQGDRCVYCERLFGSAVIKEGRLLFLKVTWDHLVPYSFSQNNYAYNFVAACQICNGIKSDLMFATLEEARVYVRALWEGEDIDPETRDSQNNHGGRS